MIQKLHQFNIPISNDTESSLEKYIELLIKWNKVHNLTSIKNPNEIITKHILDSLSIVPYLDGTRFIDIGSGAGFPGIPIALLCPEKSFTLLDSNIKKTSFLSFVKSSLQIKNVEIVTSRAEDFSPIKCFDVKCFDVVITRAFSTIRDMLATTKHLCCQNGRFFAMKGKIPKDELNDLPSEYFVEKIIKLDVPGLDAERHLICVKLRI